MSSVAVPSAAVAFWIAGRLNAELDNCDESVRCPAPDGGIKLPPTVRLTPVAGRTAGA